MLAWLSSHWLQLYLCSVALVGVVGGVVVYTASLMYEAEEESGGYGSYEKPPRFKTAWLIATILGPLTIIGAIGFILWCLWDTRHDPFPLPTMSRS